MYNKGCKIVVLISCFAIYRGAIAEYNCAIYVRNILTTEMINAFNSMHYDYEIDSMSGGTRLEVKIYRKDSYETLITQAVTDDSGRAYVMFDYWNDGQTPVTVDNIARLDIECPNAKIVARIGEQILLQDVKFENLDFTSGEIYLKLPERTVQV